MDDQRIELEYSARKKSSLVAYLLYIFLGILGAHRFYLGKYLTGILIPVLLFAGTALGGIGGYITGESPESLVAPFVLLTLGFSSIGGYVLFALYDLVTLWKQVEDLNRSTLNQLYNQREPDRSSQQDSSETGEESEAVGS
jgi:TM2 domain-containing membrane protein YozV